MVKLISHSLEQRSVERKCFYLTTHSTHFIYGYMTSDIWLRTILIVREETRCRHIGYSFWLTARVLLYAPSHRQDNTYHSLCYTSRGALAGTRNSSMGWVHPMKDRSDDPSYHERTLLPWKRYILVLWKTHQKNKQVFCLKHLLNLHNLVQTINVNSQINNYHTKLLHRHMDTSATYW